MSIFDQNLNPKNDDAPLTKNEKMGPNPMYPLTKNEKLGQKINIP